MRDYPMVILPLSDEEGGGFKVEFPDLPGCVSDGETPQEAVLNGQDALQAWLIVRAEVGEAIPEPGSSWTRGRVLREQLLMKLHAIAAIQARASAQYEEMRRDLAKSQQDMDRFESELDEQEHIIAALKDHLGMEDWDERARSVGKI